MAVTTRFLVTSALVFLSLSLVLAFPAENTAVPEANPVHENYKKVPAVPEEEYKPKPEVKKEATLPISIEGLILCRSGSSYSPIQGAVARITCLAVDVHGSETVPFTLYTCPTDVKGYFFAEFSPLELTAGLQITECRAYLDNSPLETCNIPTDVNHGITGALLSSFRILPEKQIKLYTIKPLFYTNDPKSVPGGGY